MNFFGHLFPCLLQTLYRSSLVLKLRTKTRRYSNSSSVYSFKSYNPETFISSVEASSQSASTCKIHLQYVLDNRRQKRQAVSETTAIMLL